MEMRKCENAEVRKGENISLSLSLFLSFSHSRNSIFPYSHITLKAISLAVLCLLSLVSYSDETSVTDGEVWNEGVGYFRNNDVTNALRVQRPLMLSKTHGARAAEVVAKLEYDRGNLEEAAGAAQIALRSGVERGSGTNDTQGAVKRIAEKVKSGEVLVYDADLSPFFDTIPHDKLMAALQMRIKDGSVLGLIRHWLKVCVQEPNGVRVSPKGRGTPQGGVISPLLANIYLHWFETIVSLTAKACGQVMSIVRYADDFVILTREWTDGFVQKVEGILEGRLELTVNREKTKLLDFREPHTTLTFLGYDFRMVRDRLFGTGKRYLTFGPSKKSMKRIREKIHGITHARNGKLTVEKVVGRLNRLMKGWGAFYSVGYPSKAFHAVNGYALHAPQKLCFGGDLAKGHPKGAQAGARMARFLNRRSQRRYRLKFADTYYGELNHYGMYWLKWADVRGRRN